MISLTQSEATITAKVLKTVFGANLEPSQVLNIEVTDLETVLIGTVHGLYSMGKEYFKSLVQQFKAVACEGEDERGTGRVQAPATKVQKTPQTKLVNTIKGTSIWEVIGTTGNRYQVQHNPHNGYAPRCNCKAARFGRKCYHIAAVSSLVSKELLAHKKRTLA